MIVASPFLANSIVDLHQKIEGLITIKISKISIFFTIMLALFITVSWHDIISLPSKIRHPFKNPEYPVQAAEYLRNTGSDNIFNSYGWGGYLIWTNQPQRVFIDGRGPQAKIGDSTLLNEYLNLMRGKIPEKLDEYKINTVLLDNKVSKYNYLNRVLARVMKIDINTTRGEKLKKVLESSSDWEKTYEDGISTIYSRKK
jgi:hypothetical protein